MERFVGLAIVMPIIASTIACAVMALLSLPYEYLLTNGKINFSILWPAALIVGVPASILGTLTCAPFAARAQRHIWLSSAACGIVGVLLGSLGFAVVQSWVV
jgi:hypothetical protein